MQDLDVDTILKSMENPAVGENANDLMEMLEKADVFLAKFEQFVSRLDQMGLKPLLVRGIGAKLGIDAESPLKTDTKRDITFKSPLHEKLYRAFENIEESNLKELVTKQLPEGMKID